MSGKKLTAAAVAAIPAPSSGRSYTADGTVPGLQLMVTAGGARRWVLQYRLPGAGRDGRPIKYTLGDAATLTLAQARREAERLRAAVAQGVDPAAARRTAHELERETPVMDALVTHWLDEHLAPKRSAGTVAAYRSLWRCHGVSALGALKVPDVTITHIDAIHRRAKDTPTTANRVVAMLGTFFQWCERHGHRPRHSNPARNLDRYKEEQREHYLTEEEIARLGESLRLAESVGIPAAPTRRETPSAKAMTRRKADGTAGRTYNSTAHRAKGADAPVPADPFAVGALRFALLSGWRISEVCGLRWDALDLARGTATLATSKTGRTVRPLGASALAVLSSLPRVEGASFVFPSARRGNGARDDVHRPDQPMGAPRRLWDAVRAHAQLDGVRIHDLRHSFGASAADAGQSLIMIAALLGHTQTKTSERYAKARRDVRQQAADTVSSGLAALLSGAHTDVTPIRAKR